VDEFVAGGSGEGVVDTAVEVVQRLDDVVLLQTGRDRLRHERFLMNSHSTGNRWAPWLAVAFIL
jgi:hypothetical protein